jgi:hypothetical protein
MPACVQKLARRTGASVSMHGNLGGRPVDGTARKSARRAWELSQG